MTTSNKEQGCDTEQVNQHKPNGFSAISLSFLENNTLLKKFLTRFLSQRQDIEDVVQETYLRAYKAEKDTDIEQPKAFLFRVAKNLALNELKKKSRQVTDYIEDCDARVVLHNTDSLESEVEARQHLGLYCEAIATLPEQRRRVCLLRKVHGLRHKEIAERLSITVSSVEKHLLKGTLACQAYVQEREKQFNPPETATSNTPNATSGTATRIRRESD
jgi:RNA polymerase sigma factor (sigma-70 family)